MHLLEQWHLLLCHNEHVYNSISLLALVDLHRLSICLDGWYLVLLHNWDIDDRDVLDQRDWCLLHLSGHRQLCRWAVPVSALRADVLLAAATRSRSRRNDMDVEYDVLH